ncbi:hypothetical protein FGADI_12331 [Fusarium gaditjirri]|uniref:Uncharacterized protein n=1 Tax=Fusarium gaditjirri TaxID=282569 RepID=A0A8H4SSN6_9HYPO|nr:hypothetical protein FGADI_12331 [Fusarium gaditjirri]
MAPVTPIKEKSEDCPLPVTGTRLEDFEADDDYLASRPGGRFLKSPTDRGLYKKFDLADNLRKWVKTEHPELYDNVPPEAINISAEDRANFFDVLFKGWSSAADIEDMPSKPRNRDKDDTRIHICRWPQKLPASKNKRKTDGDGESTASKRTRGNAWLRNQPAYFGIGFSFGKGEDKVSFDVKDASNQIAAAQYFEWDIANDIDELKRRPLTKWEHGERTRIRDFNQNRIFISSRNYIIRAAKAGFTKGSHLSISLPKIVELVEHERMQRASRKLAAEFCYMQANDENFSSVFRPLGSSKLSILIIRMV